MIAGTPRVQVALNILMNVILICQHCSQTFRLCHNLKGFIIYLYVVILSCICFKRHEHILHVLGIYFQANLLTSLLRISRACILQSMYVFVQQINIISAIQHSNINQLFPDHLTFIIQQWGHDMACAHSEFLIVGGGGGS